MKKLIVLSLFLLVILASNAQINRSVVGNDTIQIYKGSNSTSYYFKGEKIDFKELEMIVQENALAKDEFRKYKELGTSAAVFTVAGCGLIGGGLYLYLKNKNSISTGTNNWNLVYAGLGVVAVSIPILILSKKHLNSSVEIFNDSKIRPERKSVSLNFGVNSNGLGVQMIF
jgi:hypothetical protein